MSKALPMVMPPPPCDECEGRCCKVGAFSHPDIAVQLEWPEEDESNFPEAIPDRDRPGELGIPMVNGRCLHLDDNNQCRIYERRPVACRNYNCLRGYWRTREFPHAIIMLTHPELVKLIERRYPQWSRSKRAKTSYRRKLTNCVNVYRKDF